MQIFIYLIFLVAALLLIAMYPGRGRRERMTLFMRQMIAHRGFHDNAGDAPENSMAAVRYAVEKGFGIEMDVHETKDGQLVLLHDRNLKRVTGCDRNIDEMNWSEVRKLRLFDSNEGIPLLRDVLGTVGGKVPLIIEVKADSLKEAERTSEDLALFLDSYEGPACIESFHPGALRWFRKNRPQMLRGQLSEKFRGLPFPHRHASFFLSCCMMNFLTKPDFIAYNVRHRNLLRFRILHDLFHSVCAAWTVRSEQELADAADSFEIFIFEGFDPPRASSGETKEDSVPACRPGGKKNGKTDNPEKKMNGIVRKYMIVSGTVQAVGFRYRATYIAQTLGITGWVRNRYDDRVEMEVQGSEAALGEMLKKLNEQRFIEITGVEERQIEVVPHEYEFKVRY